MSRPLSTCVESEEDVRTEAEVPFVELLHRDIAVFFEEVMRTPTLVVDALDGIITKGGAVVREYRDDGGCIDYVKN